jgi:hypothetical protein
VLTRLHSICRESGPSDVRPEVSHIQVNGSRSEHRTISTKLDDEWFEHRHRERICCLCHRRTQEGNSFDIKEKSPKFFIWLRIEADWGYWTRACRRVVYCAAHSETTEDILWHSQEGSVLDMKMDGIEAFLYVFPSEGQFVTEQRNIAQWLSTYQPRK